MPKAKRERRERTDNWELITQWCRMQEQRFYESIRPFTLFGIPRSLSKSSDEHFSQLYRTTDGGKTWTRLTSGPGVT